MTTSATFGRGVAVLLDYTGIKRGHCPNKTTLGEVSIPETASLEDAELIIRRTYPKANWFQCYDCGGQWWASGSI